MKTYQTTSKTFQNTSTRERQIQVKPTKLHEEEPINQPQIVQNKSPETSGPINENIIEIQNVSEAFHGDKKQEPMFAYSEFKKPSRSNQQYECFLYNFKGFHYLGLWPETEGNSSLIYNLYSWFVYSLLVLFFILSLLHTIQSISHFELFTQLMVETIFVCTCFVNMSTFFLLSNRIKRLLYIMKNDFLAMQDSIKVQCIRQEKFICIVSCFLAVFTYYAIVREKIFGTPTEREVSILKKVYNRTHPERRLPVRLYSGSFDFTISPLYEPVAFYDVLTLGICFYIHYMAISTVPIFCVHIAGQLRALSHLAENIGTRESAGTHLAIIKHHIGIIRFFKEFETIFRPVFMIKVVLRLVFITLEIVQLSLLKSVTDPRFTRTLIQMTIGFTDFLFFCASSEVVNVGEETLFRSVYKSHWYVGSPLIRQRTSVMLEYLKRPLKYAFYSTFLIIDMSTFIGGMRLAYSVFTLLRSFIE